MNFVQQLEECLRDLAAEARKSHPGVKEASERATLKLRSLKNEYVSAVRKATSETSAAHPTTRLFQSSDLLHPFLLAANYPNATNALLEISFRAMRLLMEADAVVPADGLNVVRVWMIQAQVVTAYYQKQFAKELKSHQQQHSAQEESGDSASSSKSTKTSAVASSGGSSWFSWGSASSSSSITSSSNTAAATSSSFSASANSAELAVPGKLSVKNAVSSSSGQTGQGSQSAVFMDRLALEILSCLLQLVELLKCYPDSLTTELWNNAVSLACIWLYNVPSRHKVQQAAQATTVQVLTLLFQTNSNRTLPASQKLVTHTWKDLLSLVSWGVTQQSSPTSFTKKNLTGAFVLCKKAAAASNPPLPEFALELMTQIWKDGMFQPEDPLFIKTLGITMVLLQQAAVAVPSTHNKVLSVELTLRTYQWSLVLFQSRAAEYPVECREIFLHMIKPIVVATDACRSHHDFEDGFVYTQEEASAEEAYAESMALAASTLTTPSINGGPDGVRKRRSETLACFFPTPVLWKAGFAVEAVYLILDKDSMERTLLLQDKKLVASLAESLSHFATIGASCRDHILQMIDFCDFQMTANQKPDIIRKAELAVLSGKTSLFTDASAPKGPDRISGTNSSTVLGEALWISFQGMLRIAHSLQGLDDPTKLLEETFAPFLAILQHYLKRFSGSKALVELSLQGYSGLGSVCLPLQECSMQRKALLTSLAKLSLPSWGKHDVSCQLHDHHIRSLVCLLQLVHTYHESVASEWDLILWTFEELSVLHIASPLLSDEAYHTALAVGGVYGRFAAFSTCLSNECFIQMAEALTDICQAAMKDRDIVGDSETLLPGKTVMVPDQSEKKQEARDTIGGKIMSIGVKAIYGSSDNGENEKSASAPSAERTKDVFYEDYRQSFVDRVSASNNTVRIASIGRLPFSLTLLADLAIVNTFRSKTCGEAMFAQLSRLAASTAPVRPFIMDIMTSLIMYRLSTNERQLVKPSGPSQVVFTDPMLSQLLAVEPIDTPTNQESEGISHEDVLGPLCDTVRGTQRADVAESALGVVSMVLQGAGHALRGKVWSVIIESVASLSGDPTYKVDRSTPEWAGCSLMAFKCLKLIVDDFLDELPSVQGVGHTVLKDVFDCCSAFVSAHHDINTSLTAIGLLWTIADQDSQTESIDLALAKLGQLSSDNRPEVRNAVINTLFSFIVGRGGSFSSGRWKMCFVYTIFGLYDSVSIHTNATDSESEPSSHVKKPSRYKVGIHHSRDSVSKQWVATQVLVIRGIMRVLRSFFRELLDSADDEADDSDVPWLQDAWVRILDFAFEAANQDGDRDSLDIRSVGVELLGVCCQLTSKAGIQAATTPARVGTNMEVVNGALRSVRESQTSKPPMARAHSISTDSLRQSLFLESFESLECFRDAIIDMRSRNERFPDDTDLQVLHKFSAALASVYECCRSNELSVQSQGEHLSSEEINIDCKTEKTGDDERLEARFVGVVASVLNASTKPDDARFLNQAQRSILDLLKTMAGNGSLIAFDHLISNGASAFFVRKEHDGGDESESGEDANVTFVSVLNQETASIVSGEISKAPVTDDCALFVLYRTLVRFSREFPDDSSSVMWRKRHLKRFIPIVVRGLTCASKLANENPYYIEDVDLLWSAFIGFLSHALTPVPLGKDMTKIPRVPELLDIIQAAVSNVPGIMKTKLCRTLSACILTSFNSAKQYALYAKEHADTEIGRKSKKHRDELMKLTSSCFISCCLLGPEELSLRETARKILSEALSMDESGPEKSVIIEAARMICSAVKEKGGTDALAISLFPVLSQLIVSAQDSELKEAAFSVFSGVDVSGSLDAARLRYESAERRAEQAEQQVAALTAVVAELQQKNKKR